MTLAEQVQLQRSVEQSGSVSIGSEARRMSCRCGCGRWWYAERREGRPLEYATHECWAKARRERRRERWKRRAQGGE